MWWPTAHARWSRREWRLAEAAMSSSPLEKPQIIAHTQQGLNYTVFDCKWVPSSARLLCLGSFPRGTGVIQLYELQGGRLSLLREIEKSKPIKCGTFGASSLQQRYLATGDFGGNLHIWNLEAPELPVYSVKGHQEIINSIDGVGGLGIGEGAPEIVTGSRDGTVKVWDPRQKDFPVANMEPAQGESKRDCWTVAFGNAYNQDEAGCSVWLLGNAETLSCLTWEEHDIQAMGDQHQERGLQC
uniref:WD repeat-containing protein 92 n=1 Tax=Sphaerodactylus townsendi TaxID=933632 RepID=A0ACB8GEP6_9SAUR